MGRQSRTRRAGRRSACRDRWIGRSSKRWSRWARTCAFPNSTAMTTRRIGRSKWRRSEKRSFLSPFDDYAVMAANGGTVAMEVLEDAPEARVFILAGGRRGLAAGFAVWAKHVSRSQIIGCQHVLSPALQMSLDAGHAITKLPAVETMAGGVEGGIGARTFPVLAPLVDRVALVTEEEILGRRALDGGASSISDRADGGGDHRRLSERERSGARRSRRWW